MQVQGWLEEQRFDRGDTHAILSNIAFTTLLFDAVKWRRGAAMAGRPLIFLD
jgi:hypothetical protein